MFLGLVNQVAVKAFVQGVCCALSLYVGKTPLNTSKRKRKGK